MLIECLNIIYIRGFNANSCKYIPAAQRNAFTNIRCCGFAIVGIIPGVVRLRRTLIDWPRDPTRTGLAVGVESLWPIK